MPPMAPYEDRVDAGRRLGRLVAARLDGPSVVLAVPRAGVVVGAQVAMALRAPLAPLLVRKVGLPESPETVVGAIDADGALVAARGGERGLLPAELEGLGEAVAARLTAWRRAFGVPDPAALLPGRTAVVVDDALVSGLTARAGVEYLRRRGAKRIIVAVPAAREDGVQELTALGVEVIAPERAPLGASTADFYRRLQPVTEEEVRELLARGGVARRSPTEPTLTGPRPLRLVDRDGDAHECVLRLAEGIGPFPAAVLAGFGERDGERFARRLGEAGICSLRLPQGGERLAAQALDVLASRPELDPLRLSLLAAEGACAAITRAATADARVRACVLVAPPEDLPHLDRALVAAALDDDVGTDRITRWLADRLLPSR